MQLPNATHTRRLGDPAFFDQYFGKMRALLNEAKAKCVMPAPPVFGK
jgi:hypothetical protein